MPVQFAPHATPESAAHYLPPLDAEVMQPHNEQLPHYAGNTATTAEAALDLPELSQAGITDADVAESNARMQAVANGEDVQPGDTRVYDITAAEEAAHAENALFDQAHSGLVKDIELAREMAEKEDAARTEAKVKTQEAEAVAAADAKAKQQAEQQKAVADKAAASEKQAALHTEAQKALQQTGITAEIPEGSSVSKNELTGQLVITTGNHLQVLEPLPMGGYDTTEYDVNPVLKTVTIKHNGLSTLLGDPDGKFASAEGASQTAGGSYETLPPAVATMVGYAEAIKIGTPQPARAEADSQ